MKENLPQEPSLENLEAEIKELQKVLYESWAGEKFDQLPPDLQDEFIDITWEAESGKDREAARDKLKALIRKLRDL